MSDYLPSFIVEPVLRQARRFSSRTPHSGDLQDPDTPAPAAGYYEYLPNVQVPDFQRFYPSRFWNTNSPPPLGGRDETTEGTWQSLARNIQLWSNQINNLDVIPSPPLDAMQDNAVAEEDGSIAFPPLEAESATSRPVRLQEHRTNSETSLNPAQELSFRSRAFADVIRGHSQSDPVSHPGNDQPPSRLESMPTVDNQSYRRRDGSGQLPEDDGMGPLRQRISAIMAGPGTSTEKSKLIHILMTENYTRSHTPPTSRGKSTPHNVAWPTSPLSMASTHIAQPNLDLSQADMVPTYAPLDVDEDGNVQAKPDLGCEHYKRNVKMQCAACERWYTCRLCHDEVEDHVLPRRETRYMLCMLCRAPQPVGQVCRNCSVEVACYYCPVCKLWNNDPEKSIYHCDDCGICRLGQGLGKDFFHCKTCAACMSIKAETTHKCVEKSTRCDCPICGEYMFTSNRPVAFMKCGHSIHESCFTEWCNTSYKCPICSRSIANMQSQFRRLDQHIREQPMPEEYRDNRAYVFCNDCNSRSITKYHWLGLKCSICESYNTTQLELLGPEQTPEQIQEQSDRAQELGVGEAGLTASQSGTPSNELTSPMRESVNRSRPTTMHSDRARSPTSRDSPFLLPHSPTRSARSVTPVVGSYFGTGVRHEPERRGSYFSIFSAGQPTTPRSTRNSMENDEEEMGFWGRHSPRSHDADMELAEPSGESSSSEDEAMTEDDDDAEEDDMELPGHR
ncbi:hypothetical protein H2198_004724 [Neophaeococcomyces mojaviensis]|uniref:Uncharacterized protein n=1 Tax=Neophaeococcomyces mojaviensis TaxID=3383035 RepID=A0ACC3A880_9EURO|nr:hypothetical protein H2198_004724 [Knufia sp. JES_112]